MSEGREILEKEIDNRLERIKRVETMVSKAYKLARLVRRRHNQVTDAFNKNFDVFDDEVKRNTANIDKIVSTLQELMGEGKSKLPERKEDDYTRRLYQ